MVWYTMSVMANEGFTSVHSKWKKRGKREDYDQL